MSDQVVDVGVEKPLGAHGEVGPLFVAEDGAKHSRKNFLLWICKEITTAESERGGKVVMWRKWRRQREARPEHEVKNYPFPKASNVSVPIANIMGQTAYGQSQGTFSVKDPFWNVEAANRENAKDLRLAMSLTRLLALMATDENDLDINPKKSLILYESVTMGLCWVKVIWSKEEWQFRSGQEPGSEQHIGVAHEGPEVVPVPLDDILYRQAIQSVKRTPWIAHRFTLSEYEVRDLGAQGVWQNVDKVLGFVGTERDQWKRDVMRRMGVTQLPDDVYEFYEVAFRWDANGDGRSEECLVTLHVPTQTILQEGYNELGIRTLEPVGYMLRPWFIDGMGTGWLSEGMQDEVDATHNLRMDSMHLGVLPMFSVKKNCGILPGEKLFPGKFLFVNDPKDVLMLGPREIPSSSLQAEIMAKQYAERATGASDPVAGFADQVSKSRETFRGQQAKLAQNSKMFGSVIEATERSFGRIGFMVVCQMVAHRQEVLDKEARLGRLSSDEQQDVAEILDIPISEILQRFRFRVTSTDIEQTFETKRQNLLFQVQLQATFQEKMLPIMVQLSNPQVQQMPMLVTYLGKVFTSSMRTLDKILSFFDEGDKSKYIPEYKKFELFNEVHSMMLESQYEQQARALMQQMMMGGAGGQTRSVGGGPGNYPGGGGSVGTGGAPTTEASLAGAALEATGGAPSVEQPGLAAGGGGAGRRPSEPASGESWSSP